MIIPMLSNEALRNLQNECALAKDELQTALFSHWHQLGISNIEERSRVGRPRVIQCLGAYAVKIFEVEAKELVKLKLEPPDLSRCFDELGVRVTYQVMPPQFADDRQLLAHRAAARHLHQADPGYPGSLLSSADGSAIKRITAGVRAAAGLLARFRSGDRPSPSCRNQCRTKKEQ